MELQGKIIKIEPSITGTSSKGTWHKQQFILETLEQHPKKVAFELWNDDVRSFELRKVGHVIKVLFNVESREHEEKWYTSCRAWKINVIGE